MMCPGRGSVTMTLLQTSGDPFPDAESHLVNKKLIQQPESDHISRVYSLRLEEFSSDREVIQKSRLKKISKWVKKGLG